MGSGSAKDLKPNSPPVIGGGILFGKDHVAVIIGFEDDGYLIDEGNIPIDDKECQTRQKIVPYNSEEIRGFVVYPQFNLTVVPH